MTSEATPAAPELGPVRALLARVGLGLFIVLLVLMLLGGAAIVLTQSIGLLTGNADLVAGGWNTLSPYVLGAAAALGVLSLFLAYVNGWKSSE